MEFAEFQEFRNSNIADAAAALATALGRAYEPSPEVIAEIVETAELILHRDGQLTCRPSCVVGTGTPCVARSWCDKQDCPFLKVCDM